MMIWAGDGCKGFGEGQSRVGVVDIEATSDADPIVP